MTELTGIPIPNIDWHSGNLPETLRKFRRTCQYIFDGPLAEKDEKIKVQYLMLWVGQEGRDICDGWGLSAEDNILLTPHWKGFGEYAKPKSSFRVSRFQLRALKQEPTETVDAFMTRARIIANDSEYTDKEEQLMDTLIAGINNNDIRRRLISKGNATTLDEALGIVRAFESTARQMDDIQQTRQIQSVNKQHAYQHPKMKTSDLHGCYRCGQLHDRSYRCPAADSVCRYCNTIGHWACVCLKQKRDQDSGARPKQQPQSMSKNKYYGKKKVHVLHNNENSDKEDDNFVLDTIETTQRAKLESIYKEGSKSQAFANIRMEGQTANILVKCKIDSGAEVNVMPQRVFKHLFPDNKDSHGKYITLQKSKVSLSAYGGAKVKQFGCFTLLCTHNDITLNIEFHVTEDNGSTMLGLQSCISMRLISLNCENKSVCNDCHNTSEVNSLNRDGNNPSSGGRSGNAKKGILEKYPKCFRGVGLFPGEYHIDLKQDAKPVIHPPRRVPGSMKEAVKKELSRMIDIDIIEKVDQPTDWVNSVVYVTKPSGELRICLDPKDLNTCVRRPHHYTQVLEDILPQLQGASVFTILDARSGYWNVKLDDESKLLTTFNTPYGRYCFRRLPCGLISAQDVFQKKVDQTFEDLPGVIAIADDIVVFGKTEAEHDKHLDDVMKRTQHVGLCLNPDKCVVKSDRIKFFGNYLSSNGLEPDPDKIAATVDMSPPTNTLEFQTFLGMANYLSRYTANLATKTSVLPGRGQFRSGIGIDCQFKFKFRNWN